MAIEKHLIYIPLLDEGTPVSRPTFAEKISDRVYRVLAIDGYDENDEMWAFPPGTLVTCEKVVRSTGEILLAQAKYIDRLSPD